MKTIKKIEIRSQRIKVSENQSIYSRELSSPELVVQIAQQITKGMDQELFLVFLLDVRNKILGYVECARGAIDSCTVDPRIVFRAAVVVGASNVILIHNHPSGSVQPSTDDDNITKRLVKCGTMLGVEILDHVVVSDQGHFSYKVSYPQVLSKEI